MRDVSQDVLRELRVLAGQVPVGSTNGGLICPSCAGGRTREASFSVRRLDALTCTFKCYRATCDYHGRLSGTTCFVATTQRNDSGGLPRQEGFCGAIQPLGAQWLSELCACTLLGRNAVAEYGFMEEVDGGRLVVPIRGPYGEDRGVQLRRSRHRRSTTHVDRDYRTSDGTWMGWFKAYCVAEKGKGPVVLVEDVLSAACVAQAGLTSASLMGSHISMDAILEASAVAAGGIVLIALDRDASGKAIRAVSRFECVASSPLRALILDKDLKYVERTTIMKMVRDVTTDD